MYFDITEVSNISRNWLQFCSCYLLVLAKGVYSFDYLSKPLKHKYTVKTGEVEIQNNLTNLCNRLASLHKWGELVGVEAVSLFFSSLHSNTVVSPAFLVTI